jgi:hypothetical protein
MKKKIISSTYLRDVPKYELKIYLDQDDYYIAVKKLIDVEIPFIIKNNITVMDNGYYVFEVVPKHDNYAMRLFLNDKKEPLEYYFDICKNNGLYEKTNIPCYDDLYLDITYMNGEINILDEDELIDAYRSGDINDDDLKLVYEVKDKLLEEIKNHTNKCMNIDFNIYIDF